MRSEKVYTWYATVQQHIYIYIIIYICIIYNIIYICIWDICMGYIPNMYNIYRMNGDAPIAGLSWTVP